MSWTYQLLGLAQDASESDVKRAYARKLKTTRPDDDPAAFQRLHDAYQAALEECRWRAQIAQIRSNEIENELENQIEEETPAAVLVVHDDPAPVPKPQTPPAVHKSETNTAADGRNADTHDTAIDEPPPVPERHFHYGRFLADIHSYRGQPPIVLLAWLRSHPDLYNLQLKAILAQALQASFARGELQAPEAQLRVLADFFGYEVNQWLLDKMLAHEAIEREETARYGEQEPMLIRQLKRPFSRLRALLYAAVNPTLPRRFVKLSDQLQAAYGGEWPELLDKQLRDFFARLCDPAYAGVWRWALIGLRAFLSGMVPWIFFVALLLLQGPANPQESLASINLLALWMALIIGGGDLLISVFRLLRAICDDAQRRGNARLKLLPIYLSCAALALVSLPFPGAVWLAGISAICALLLPLLMRRHNETICFTLAGLIWMPAVLDSLLLPNPIPQIIGMALAPLAMGLFDYFYAKWEKMPFHAVQSNIVTRLAALTTLFPPSGIFWLFRIAMRKKQ
ncbi:MAG: J domain-containing protein [Pseudomonadales bacterium]|jgi:hypothetical protein|nr:J domain-containing protein [Pseudomonadales bacterium]